MAHELLNLETFYLVFILIKTGLVDSECDQSHCNARQEIQVGLFISPSITKKKTFVALHVFLVVMCIKYNDIVQVYIILRTTYKFF